MVIKAQHIGSCRSVHLGELCVFSWESYWTPLPFAVLLGEICVSIFTLSKIQFQNVCSRKPSHFHERLGTLLFIRWGTFIDASLGLASATLVPAYKLCFSQAPRLSNYSTEESWKVRYRRTRGCAVRETTALRQQLLGVRWRGRDSNGIRCEWGNLHLNPDLPRSLMDSKIKTKTWGL